MYPAWPHSPRCEPGPSNRPSPCACPPARVVSIWQPHGSKRLVCHSRQGRCSMSTLEALQRLYDGEFHSLGDALLRRLAPTYRLLRTHGLNEAGESIKGQPDSYVGETATSCTVAVCYTVQRSGWWRKVVDDVKEAVAASPAV